MAQYLLVSFNQNLPPTARGRSLETIVKDAVTGYGEQRPFPVSTELAKFTSTDELMSVADDLSKIDVIAYSLVTRAARGITDLAKKIQADNQAGWADISPIDTFGQLDPPQLHIDLDDGVNENISLDQALEHWEWNESMFSSQRLVKDMFSHLQSEVNQMEEGLRTSNSAFQDAATKVNNLRRRNEGSLLVRSLDSVGSKMQLITCLEDYQASAASKNPIYVNTTNLTTVLVVVRRSNVKEFEAGYDLGESYVVPRSLQRLEEDNDFICYSVTLVRVHLDEYKTQTKEKGWHVREFKYNQTMREDMRNEAKSTVEGYLKECERYKDILERSFTHIAVTWIHLRALRIFVESTLLYGIPPKFQTFLIKAAAKNVSRIHRNLEAVFGDGMAADDDEGAVSEENEYHSYVSFSVNLYGLVPLNSKK